MVSGGARLTTYVAHVSEPHENFEALLLVDHDSDDSIEIQRSVVFDDQDRQSGWIPTAWFAKERRTTAA